MSSRSLKTATAWMGLMLTATLLTSCSPASGFADLREAPSEPPLSASAARLLPEGADAASARRVGDVERSEVWLVAHGVGGACLLVIENLDSWASACVDFGSSFGLVTGAGEFVVVVEDDARDLAGFEPLSSSVWVKPRDEGTGAR